ncbi:hypothetical protein AB0J28_30210 [Streptosporangium canum]|uniref:hypothetical protein n=1 Tax=Streptosporangium canum TaxID=324952 RepID=UPI00344337C3
MFEVVSCPAGRQQSGDADQLIGIEIVAVLAHQHAEHVLARVGLGTGQEVGHGGAGFPLRRDALVHRRGGVQQARGMVLEGGAVGMRHARQLVDHR